MSELHLIKQIRPDIALPEPDELTFARGFLTAAIAAATDSPVPVAAYGRCRHRRRRVTLIAAAVTGMAAAAAAAVLVATAGPGRIPGHSGGRAPVATAAIVLSRMERALTSAVHGHLIQEIHAVGNGAQFNLGSRQGSGVVAPRAVIRWYLGHNRVEGLTAAGKRVFDATVTYSYAPRQAVLSSVAVDYRAKTWWRGRLTAGGVSMAPIWAQPHTCPAATLPSPAGSPGRHWPADIRLALRCGSFHVAGTGRVDGVDVIKIVPKPQRPPHGLQVVSAAVWVSRATYLPVRAQWTWPLGHGSATGSLTGDFTWLTPTRANLASLHTTIPGGFRQEPSGGFTEPGFSFADNPRIRLVLGPGVSP